MHLTSQRSAERWRAFQSSSTRRHRRCVSKFLPTARGGSENQCDAWLMQHLRVSDLLHMLDRNHDGKVSRQELKKWLEGRLLPWGPAFGCLAHILACTGPAMYP
jgi:hypothetical protein